MSDFDFKKSPLPEHVDGAQAPSESEGPTCGVTEGIGEQFEHLGTESIRRGPWARAGDMALVAGMLRKHGGAWREFFDCFGQLIKTRIASSLKQSTPRLNRTRRIEKIGARIEAFLKSDKMAALRKFDSRRGSLSSWARRLAEQATRLYLEELADPPRDTKERQREPDCGELGQLL
jgi:hypothetical protein